MFASLLGAVSAYRRRRKVRNVANLLVDALVESASHRRPRRDDRRSVTISIGRKR